MRKSSLWRIGGRTVYIDPVGRAYSMVADVTVPQVLKAYDEEDEAGLYAFFKLRWISTDVKGLDWVLARRKEWQAPLSAGMFSFGKGVDTYNSTEDRDLEFQAGGVSAAGDETPYQWIYKGGLHPQLRRSPELFPKVHGGLITGPGGKIGRRKLAEIVKPEAEFTAVLAPGTLHIVGWTIGNDQTVNVGGNDGTNIVPGESSNTLLLPQAKVFRHCAGIGPCIVLSKEYPDKTVKLTVRIVRGDVTICEQTMQYGDYVRDTRAVLDGWVRPEWEDLIAPEGGFFMLGTGTRIPNEASVLPGDRIVMECPELFPASFEQEVVEVP